jgi:IS6 family transposase
MGEDGSTTSQPKSVSILPTLNATDPAWHHVEQYANNPIEANQSQLKHRLRPMRGLRTDQTAQVIITGHAFIQNLRRGHYELAIDAPPMTRVAAAFTELAQTI